MSRATRVERVPPRTRGCMGQGGRTAPRPRGCPLETEYAMKKVALAALGALLLITSACGGTDAPSSTADGKKIVRALTTALTDTAQGVEAKDATCIATHFVDALDVEPLVKAK